MTSLGDRYLPRVHVSTAGTKDLAGVGAPVLLAANHASRLDVGFVLRAAPSHLHASPLPPAVAVRLRRSPVLFPERGTTPDGSLGHFHDDALRLARSAGFPVVPVAIRGSFGLDTEPSRWQVDATPRVLVRFGAPMTAPSPDELRDAVAQLLVEDATSWWAALTSGPAETAAVQGSDDGWLTAWQGLAPVRRPGESRRPTIWR